MLPAVDEAYNDESFAVFRANILTAIEQRDRPYILSILTEDIRNSFGGDGGIEEFRDLWNFDQDDSEFWTEFEAVIRLGGVFISQNEFLAPYVFAMWPGRLDVYEHAAVTGTRVNVRSGPAIAAAAIDQLSHEIVRLADGWQEDVWIRVLLADGRAGYVHKQYLRSPIDYRASFIRKDNRWLLRFFVAGD